MLKENNRKKLYMKYYTWKIKTCLYIFTYIYILKNTKIF